MAIFGRTNINIESGDSMNIQPTIECGYELMYQGYESLIKLEASMYIADIMIEDRVLHEGADESVLIEGALRNIVDKAKILFRKIKEKLRTWFNKIKTTLFVSFANIYKVIEKHEQIILKKAKENPIYYDGYVYGDIIDIGQKMYDEIEKDLSNNVTVEDAMKYREDIRADKTKYSREKVIEAMRGSKDPKVNLSMRRYVADMISFIKNYKNLASAISSMHDDIQRKIDGIIKTLEKTKDGADETNAKILNAQIAAGREYSKDAQTIMLTMTSIGKEMFRNYSMLLRKQAKVKSLKESYVGGSGNILEAAMELL